MRQKLAKKDHCEKTHKTKNNAAKRRAFTSISITLPQSNYLFIKCECFLQMQGYKELTHFEAAGNILQTAFLFLWERAEKLESIRISGEIVNPSSGEENEDKTEAIFSLRCVESYFRHNGMKWLQKFDVPVSFATLPAANKFLELLPITMDYIAMLTITIDMNDVISEEAVEDAISTVFTRMVNFKLSCKRREVEQNCQIKWKWKPEGLLTILLNQQLMTSMAEFVQP